MLLLRAIFSLFEARPPVRGDLPPVPRTNRKRDLVYGLIIGSAVLCGCFWLLYLDITNPTEEARAADEQRTRAARMADVESRPISVSLTYFDDPSAASAPVATKSETVVDTGMILPERPRRIEVPTAPTQVLLRPTIEFAPPPAALLEPSFDLPASAPVAPPTLNEPAPGR